LPAAFYERDVRTVARGLLGAWVASGEGDGLVELQLTEVEAYAGETDPGSHAYRGRTRRNATMFGPPGRAYVYFTYGMHWCANLVCAPEGTARAVLLRAGAVGRGIELARARRERGVAIRDRDLARGPARLTVALGVTGTLDGVDVTDPGSPLRVLAGTRVPRARVAVGPRVGVRGAGAPTPWRFSILGDPTVSGYRPG